MEWITSDWNGMDGMEGFKWRQIRNGALRTWRPKLPCSTQRTHRACSHLGAPTAYLHERSTPSDISILPNEIGAHGAAQDNAGLSRVEHLVQVPRAASAFKMDGLGQRGRPLHLRLRPRLAPNAAQAKRIKHLRQASIPNWDLGSSRSTSRPLRRATQASATSGRGCWRLTPTMDKPDFLKMLQNMLDPRLTLAPAIKARIEAEPFQILFLTRHRRGVPEPGPSTPCSTPCKRSSPTDRC